MSRLICKGKVRVRNKYRRLDTFRVPVRVNDR
ncbi:MAG TPA: hypothetical protein [Caudoviricetes sp.]|nr:MAG TPA: hypothetical protein [Caudoviricetes sp.]